MGSELYVHGRLISREFMEDYNTGGWLMEYYLKRGNLKMFVIEAKKRACILKRDK